MAISLVRPGDLGPKSQVVKPVRAMADSTNYLELSLFPDPRSNFREQRTALVGAPDARRLGPTVTFILGVLRFLMTLHRLSRQT
jgi:hypothetical protein